MRTLPSTRLVLAGVVVVFGGALAALTVHGDGGDAGSPAVGPAADRSDTVETPGALAADGGRAGATPPAPAPGSSASPQAGSGSPPTARDERGPAYPRPRPGSYRYLTSGDSKQSAEQTETVTVDGDRVEVRRGAGREEWRWSDRRVVLVALLTADADDEGRCEFRPPVVTLDFPLRSGRTWSSEATCNTGDSYRLERRVEATVLREGRTTVGDASVAVWVVGLTETTEVRSTFTPPPDYQGPPVPPRSTTTSVFRGEVEFAPQLGLEVRRSGTTTVTSTREEKPYERRTTKVLLDVAPA